MKKTIALLHKSSLRELFNRSNLSITQIASTENPPEAKAMDQFHFMTYARGLITILLLNFIAIFSFAQEKAGTPKNTIIVRAIIENGDTIPYLYLPEVVIIAKRTFKNDKEKSRYYRLVWNVKKVYPYAVLAGVKLKEYNNLLAQIPLESQRKIYMKKAEKELKEQFGSDLKKLSLTQGQILIKLIDRETGNTSYALVQELRGNFSAFMWQSLALLFGNNLKMKYDPTKGEDKQIEQIIHQIEDGVI